MLIRPHVSPPHSLVHLSVQPLAPAVSQTYTQPRHPAEKLLLFAFAAPCPLLNIRASRSRLLPLVITHIPLFPPLTLYPRHLVADGAVLKVAPSFRLLELTATLRSHCLSLSLLW